MIVKYYDINHNRTQKWKKVEKSGIIDKISYCIKKEKKMGEFFQQFKQQLKVVLKKTAKHAARITAPILAIVLIAIIIVGGLGYEMTRQDGSYDEGNMANVPYAASTFTSDVIIEKDGTIRTTKTAEELWEEMRQNNSRIDEYLNGPEELLKLMNAEIVTNYPDTRPEDEIDTPLDDEFWRNLNSKTDSTETQGIIKFKRAMDDGTTKTMTYVNSDTFYQWLELYSANGDENAKQNALTHFTIEENPAAVNKADLNYNGKDILTDISERIVAAAKVTPWPGEGLCQAWVRAVYRNAGLGDVGYPKAVDAYHANVVSTSMDNIPIGAAVYGTGTGSYGAGHVGIYIGNGMVMDSQNSGIETSSLEDWVAWQENYQFYVDGRTGWLGWGWQAGQPSKILSENSSNKNDDNKDTDKTVSTSDMKLITDNGKITFYNGDGSAMEGGKQNAIGYDLSEGQVAMKNLSQYKNSVIYIQTSDSGEGSYANGKFFYVTDTGGGLADNQVDVYADVDQSTLNAAPYGSYGSGAKIYLVEENVTLEDYQSKYLNKTQDSTVSGGGLTGEASRYNVVVATWSRTEETKTSNDPNIEQINPAKVSLSMTTQKIDYQQLVKGYTMPFDYLWALIVTGRDKSFSMDLAELVYNSEIEITVHDNLTKTTDIEIYNYDKETKIHTHNVYTTISYGNEADNLNTVTVPQGGEDAGWEDPFKTDSYETKHTVITYTNTLNVSLTKADVWIVDYSQEFSYSADEEKEPEYGDPVEFDISTLGYSADYPDDASPNYSDNSDPAGLAQNKANAQLANYSSYTYHSITDIRNQTDYYYRYINPTVTHGNAVTSKKYNSSPAKIIEKTDWESEEENFVTLLRKRSNYDVRNNIMSAPEWLFEILESNDRTVDMVDLTKYLLYKATGKDYGVTEYDFSTFDPNNFKSVSSTNGTLSVTTTNLTREEFIAAVQGYSAAISKGTGTQVFRDNAGVIYDVCVRNNINPVLCAAQAWQEQNWDDPSTSPYNYWGIAVYNGQNYGNSYTSMENAVEGYCKQINSQMNGDLKPIYQARAAEFATVNNKFKGDMSTMYDIFSAYAYIGDGHTLQEEADYAADYVDSLIQCATQIFGEGALVASSGGASGIIATCQEVTQEFLNRNARYSLSNLIWGDIERCWTDSECICCASYVSLVLYRSGALTPAQINAYNYQYTGSGGVPDMLQAAGWQRVSPSQAQPGDVVVDYEVHAMIYAGDGKVWDQTSCVISSSGNPPIRGTRDYNISGCQIWRAP